MHRFILHASDQFLASKHKVTDVRSGQPPHRLGTATSEDFDNNVTDLTWAPPTMPESTHPASHTTDVIDVDALEEDVILPNAPRIPSVPLSDLEAEELLQPIIDIQSQFKLYNKKHFFNRIINTTVEYSTRMTLCAGTCTFRPPNVRIALSEPLLKFRPRSDLLSTLLHEMIHAYLFLTEGLARDGPDGHGPMFMSHVNRINNAEPAVNITPYHQFREEVEHYRVHHWRCEKCHNLIKRAMNRAPGSADQFWETHQTTCGGIYIKIAGPPKKEKPAKPPKHGAVAVTANAKDGVPKGVMKTFRIDDMLSGRLPKPKVKMAGCPVCGTLVKQHDLNNHLDSCLSESAVFTQPGNVPPPPQQTRLLPNVRSTSPFAQRDRATSPVRKRHRTARPENRTPRTVDKSGNYSGSLHEELISPNNGENSVLAADDVTKYIVDPDVLREIALAPKKFSLEQVDRIFSNPPPKVSPPKHANREDGIKDFLHSLIHPETASSREKQAIAMINPLRLGYAAEPISLRKTAERLSLSSHDLMEFIEENSREDGNRRLVLPEQCLDMLLSSKGPISRHGHPSRTKRRPPLTNSAREGSGRTRKRDSETLGPTSRSLGHTEPDRRQLLTSRDVKQRGRSKVCPICENHVVELNFDKHISSCVEVAQAQEHDPRGRKRSGSREERHRTSGEQERSQKVASVVEKGMRCPICDVALSREELSVHVARCMTSTGLADAF